MSDFFQNLRARAVNQWDAWQQRRRSTSADGTGAPIGAGRIAVLILVVLAAYYPVGMILSNRIDDDVSFQPSKEYVAEGGSKAVATVAALVDREADHWLANKPFLHPASALDNAPNFQLGVIYAVSRFAVELGDYIGRMRGSSSINADLDQAAGLLKYDGRTWFWGQGNIIPTAKAESQYRTAVQALLRYNKQVAAGNATYDRRADNLIALLDRVAADLGSASATLDARAKLSTGYFDTTSDDVFYDVKGKMYGYYLILRDVGADFDGVLQQKNSGPVWQNMLESLRTGAEMDPLVVANGRQDSMLVPSHLAALGFHLLRARQQIREIGDILQK